MNLSKQDVRFKKYLSGMSNPDEYVDFLLRQRKKATISTYGFLMVSVACYFIDPACMALFIGAAVFSHVDAASSDSLLRSIFLIDRFGSKNPLAEPLKANDAENLP